MKRNHKLQFLTALFFMLVCTFTLSFQVSAATMKKKLILKTGETKQLKVKGAERIDYDPYGYINESIICSISSDGVIKAKKPGIVHLTVKADDENLSCTIIIIPKKQGLKVKNIKTGVKIYCNNFELKMPVEWKKYSFYIIKTKNPDTKCVYYSFRSKKNFLRGFRGDVFTIAKCKNAYIGDVKENPGYRFQLGEKNGISYHLLEPTDVAFDYENKACMKVYTALRKVIRELPERFTLK